MRHVLSTLALGPVLYLQGRKVRRTVPRLPEASGARSGVDGEGPSLSLLIAGDSAAAGVGAETQDEALAGRLVSALRDDFEVTWTLEARTGATTADTVGRLSRLPARRFDVLLTSLGVNDVTRGITLSAWVAQQRALLDLARERFGTALFVLAGLPPVDRFPALPQPLRWYLGRRAKQLTRRLDSMIDTEPGAHRVDLRFSVDPSLMAVDGFHPGPVIYRGWAERAARVIRAERPEGGGVS